MHRKGVRKASENQRSTVGINIAAPGIHRKSTVLSTGVTFMRRVSAAAHLHLALLPERRIFIGDEHDETVTHAFARCLWRIISAAQQGTRPDANGERSWSAELRTNNNQRHVRGKQST
jgi:hypothetical protein